MVVRSVVRRSRLRELGVREATFRATGAPVPVGATVDIPSDKSIKASVTFQNTGSGTVSGHFTVAVMYADTLSDSSGNPEADFQTWFGECDDWHAGESDLTLNPGASTTLETGTTVPADQWTEGTTLDAGVVLVVTIGGTNYYLDSLKIDDAVKIIAPTMRVGITGVTFSEA